MAEDNWSPDGTGKPVMKNAVQKVEKSVRREETKKAVEKEGDRRISKKTGMTKTDPPPNAAITLDSFKNGGIRKA